MKLRGIRAALLAFGTIALLPLAAPAAHAAAARSQDTADINKLYNDFNDAFNNHDAHALAAMFTADADYIVIPGNMIHGSAEIEQHMLPLFAGRLKSLHRDVSVREVRFLTPTIAILVGDYTSNGRMGPNGPLPSNKGIYDWVVTKRGGHWMINLWHEADLAAAAPAAGPVPAQAP